MSQLIPQHFIQDVVARTDIIELIQARIKLKKHGANYQACCPFHQEKTPSFSVSPSKQFYYCFGCQASGNVISFLMDYDRMDFIECVEYLAGQLGLDVPRSEQASRQHADQKPLLDIALKVAQFYQQTLKNTEQAKNYLKSRGLTGETAKEFILGYAPAGWNNLQQALTHNAKDRQALLGNGLLIQGDKGSYDRFRARIMFPIRNMRGRVIAFGGRTLGDDTPKYLNSPETPLFHKSNELYGLYETRQKNRQLKQIILVEGYMDVIALHQHGITCAVATLGTACNIKHLQKVLRYCKKAIFCFDGDRAGKEAAWKAVLMSLPILRDGIDIRFLFLADGQDPDSLVRQIGADQFEKELENSNPLPEVFFKTLQQQNPINTTAGKAQFTQQAATHLATMPQGVYRHLLEQQLATLVGIDKQQLTQLMTETYKEERPAIKQKIKFDPFNQKKLLPPAYLAITLLLNQPNLIQTIPDMNSLNSIKSPGINLLIDICLELKKYPTATAGHLLTCWQDPEKINLIAQLAARKPSIPQQAIKVEFLATLKRLNELNNSNLIEQLIAKSRQSGLTNPERQELQNLLAQKAKIRSPELEKTDN